MRVNSSSVRLSSTTMSRPESIQAFSSGGVDAFGAVVVLDPFAERLGGHVDAAEQHVAGGRPGLRAAVQDRDVGAADAFQPGGEAFGQAAAVIGAEDARRQARQQRAGAEFAARQRAGDRPEQVRGAEFAFLAGVEQGEFVPVGDPAAQGAAVCVRCPLRHVAALPMGNPRWTLHGVRLARQPTAWPASGNASGSDAGAGIAER